MGHSNWDMANKDGARSTLKLAPRVGGIKGGDDGSATSDDDIRSDAPPPSPHPPSPPASPPSWEPTARIAHPRQFSQSCTRRRNTSMTATTKPCGEASTERVTAPQRRWPRKRERSRGAPRLALARTQLRWAFQTPGLSRKRLSSPSRQTSRVCAPGVVTPCSRRPRRASSNGESCGSTASRATSDMHSAERVRVRRASPSRVCRPPATPRVVL